MVATVIVLMLGASVWFVASVARDVPIARRCIGTMAQATTLLDAKDRQAFTIFREQRIDVPLSSVSKQLVQAILAIEDQRFYDHRGVDIVRVAGAALNNVVEGRLAQGGSTLTQQLARQSFLTPDKTFRRKLTEIFVAARLERQYSKDEILAMYLNKVYFGDGLYGVEAASLGYFGKHADEVSLAEAALLAGLVKAPSAYAPTVSVDRAKARRNVVLQAMRGEKMIDRAAYDAASREPVVLDDGLRRGEAYGQYFKEEVRRFLVQRFGWERVYQGGLKVYTTVDLDMQKAAEAEVTRGLADIEKRQGAKMTTGVDSLQAALVAMDPHTGHVLAMVGGRDFEQTSFNRATQAKRQPGSAFKPFVYAAALERGFSPATLIDRLDEPIQTLQGAWVPEDEHSDSPSMTMRTALRTSSNRAAVRMLDDVGIPITVQYAQRMGVGSVPSVPSLALGSGEVTLLSMTTAFSTFANDGIVPTPVLVRRVETSDGAVLYRDEHVDQRAITAITAFQMAEMLADVGTPAPRGRRGAGFMLPAGQDRHDQRLSRRLVRRLHTATDDRRVGRLRPAAHDYRPRLRRRARRAHVGPLHEGSDAKRQAGVVQPSGQRHHRAYLSPERQARNRCLPRQRSGAAHDGVLRELRRRHRADRIVPAPQPRTLAAVPRAGGAHHAEVRSSRALHALFSASTSRGQRSRGQCPQGRDPARTEEARLLVARVRR
jgi:penicillin-binding protein 1A